MTQRPEIPQDDYGKPMGGGNKEPLPLLPDREWLSAVIASVKYQYAIFNNQVQNIQDQEGNDILDGENQPIPRKEFEILFEFTDYQLPNEKPRKAWLRMSASKGENAHLPVFLASVLGEVEVVTPSDVIQALSGMQVSLQLSNKKGKKDPTKTYQNVLFDAVKKAGDPLPTVPPAPMTEEDVPNADPLDSIPTQEAPSDDIPF